MKSIFAAQSLQHEGQRAMTTERLVNMFPESSPRGREEVTLRSVPGLKRVVQLGPGRVRKMISTPDGIFGCAGGDFALWNGATVDRKGGVADDTTTMAFNGTQVAVVAGGTYSLWDGSAFSTVAGTVFTDFGAVDYVDGYFVFNETTGGRHSVSGLQDGASLDALDFASAEHKPDELVRVVVNGGLLWMFGETTIEPWENIGATDYPFARLQSTIIEKGLKNKGSVERLDNQVFWHGSDNKIYRTEAFNAARVSTHGVEASLDAHQQTVCFSYQYQGHDFFVVRFPDRPAWVYDPATGSWHERRTGVSEDAWNVTATVFHDGIWYAGTRDGWLCTFEGYQDEGDELRREAQSLNVSTGGERFRVSRLDLRCEAGTGGTVVASFSSDGGRTYTRERSRSLGAVGKYDQRTQWRALGQHREFSARVWCSDNVDFAIYGAGIDIA